LEAYVLGTLTEEETLSVAATIKLYPELSQEVNAIEEALLSFAETDAIKPPGHLQNAIWSAIQEADQPHTAINETVSKRPLETAIRLRRFSWAMAAVWIGLIGSLLANVLLWNDRKVNTDERISLEHRVNEMSAQQQQLQAKLNRYGDEYKMLSNPNVQRVVMQSIDPTRTMTGMVMYNKAENELYVSMLNMPAPPSGKQYQLWVIQGGKPVSLGMVSNSIFTEGSGLEKLSAVIHEGQAFALSLEKEGGSITPTEVMVVGKITS
jgi:anti-sigma-K factor RskA